MEQQNSDVEGNKKMMSLSEDHLKELAKDPKNLVYHFKDREKLPAEEVVPLNRMKGKIERLYALYCAERKKFIDKNRPVTKKRWNCIKTKILQVEEWKQLDHTHPLIVDRILNPETTEKEIEALQFMVFLKGKQEENEITDGLETFHDYLIKEFSLTKEQYADQKKRDGIK